MSIIPARLSVFNYFLHQFIRLLILGLEFYWGKEGRGRVKAKMPVEGLKSPWVHVSLEYGHWTSKTNFLFFRFWI